MKSWEKERKGGMRERETEREKERGKEIYRSIDIYIDT